MHDNTYFDEQTLYKFFMTLTKTKGVGPELAERIITEIQNNGFLIRERSKYEATLKPKAYVATSVKPPTFEEQQPLLPEIYLDH